MPNVVAILCAVPVLAMALAVAPAATAEPVPAAVQALETDAQALVRRARHPGLAVAVVDRGEVVWSGAFGQTGRGGGAMAVDTPMPLGELGELYLGALALRLAHRGELDLDRPLPVADLDPRGLDAGAPTLRQALSHHSGLRGLRLHGMYREPDVPDDGVDPLAELYLLDRPGLSQGRSPLAIELVARALESAAGASLPELIQREVAGPLGLAAPRVGGRFEATLHDRGRPEPTREAREAAALGMQASLSELAALVAALWPDRHPEWLPGSALQPLYVAQNHEARPDLRQRTALAYRLEFDTRPGVGAIARIDSTVPASHASVRLAVDHGVGVVAVANFGEANRALPEVLDEALDALLRERLPGLAARDPDAAVPLGIGLPEGVEPDSAADRYASFAGVIAVDGVDGTLDVRWLGWRFGGYPRGDGWYRPRLRVLRIPIGLGALERVALRPVRIQGERVLLVTGPSGRMFVLGRELPAHEVPEQALASLGRYRIQTVDALLERGRVREVELVHEDGLLRLQAGLRAGPLSARLDLPLVHERDGYFRVPGLGPGLGERVELLNGEGPPRIRFSGYEAVREP